MTARWLVAGVSVHPLSGVGAGAARAARAVRGVQADRALLQDSDKTTQVDAFSHWLTMFRQTFLETCCAGGLAETVRTRLAEPVRSVVLFLKHCHLPAPHSSSFGFGLASAG